MVSAAADWQNRFITERTLRAADLLNIREIHHKAPMTFHKQLPPVQHSRNDCQTLLDADYGAVIQMKLRVMPLHLYLTNAALRMLPYSTLLPDRDTDLVLFRRLDQFVKQAS